MANVKNLVKGEILLDTSPRSKRRLLLKDRVNPQGAEVKPYWVVENEATKKITTIREDRLSINRFVRLDAGLD